MTEKKEKIIAAALKLFAKNGFIATSTRKIAHQACVSEGLIFRHFQNKEGLLNAIIENGKDRLQSVFASIIFENDPKKMIKKTIEVPFEVLKNDQEYWRLQYKLKWELTEYDNSKYEPLIHALTEGFRKLEYQNPELEAEFLVLYIDGFGASLLKGIIKNPQEMKNFLLTKYNV